MRLKDIGRKIGDIAFRVAMSTCERGGGCGECGSCGNYVNLHTLELGNEKKDHESKEVVT